MTTPMTTPLGAGPIEISPLSDSEWRASDSRIPIDDTDSVLGVVEQADEQHYRLLQLGPGPGIEGFTFGSLDEVAEHFLSPD